MVEAKRRDHRVLGKKLDLFSLQEDAGGGLVSSIPSTRALTATAAHISQQVSKTSANTTSV